MTLIYVAKDPVFKTDAVTPDIFSTCKSPQPDSLGVGKGSTREEAFTEHGPIINTNTSFSDVLIIKHNSLKQMLDCNSVDSRG